MTPDEELALVKKAILLGQTVSGCCEWHDRAVHRVEREPDLQGVTPDEIRTLTINFVVAGGRIHQVKEQRPEYNDYDFYYKIVFSVSELSHELFVELRLVDSDADVPAVLIVNAHPQRN
ncbi:MAG: hypothetical protein HYX68_19205 [Planctomycetes bacterium]|nr:hypothetical protein [Planctomycetota bacterium]